MRRTIVIAGGISGDRRELCDILAYENYELVQTDSDTEAVALARALQIDAFILDLHTLKTTALEMCDAIRSVEYHRSTPVIFLLGKEEEELLSQALACGGGIDFIWRPYLPTVVRARLKINLERAEYLRRLEHMRRILKRYLSKRTLAVIENTPLSGQFPPPQEQDLAVCFTDMRGFTALSEDTEPTRLFSMVSALLADQVQIVHEHGGYVDKFGGDGVMAIFDGPEMVLQSCLCALKILESTRVNDPIGSPDMFRFGIGIHTGRAVIGNIGSPEHLDYSAIGSTVNLAARLCGEAQATSIAVSKAVRDLGAVDPRLRFHSERRVPVKGIKDLVTVYTLSRG
jgi:adenylate cyclase